MIYVIAPGVAWVLALGTRRAGATHG
jgi:hypothetical protein